MNKIILASASPRRKQLLELAEIPFEVIVSGANESFPEILPAAEIAMHIAENKAMAVQEILNGQRNNKGQTIVAADTVVVLENKIIGKPKDREEAIQILTGLSGKTHYVITGVCILRDSERKLFAEKTEVDFNPLSLSQIEYYVDHYKPYDKAGAYAIQEWIGAIGIQSIKGDFYNVMGLPINKLVKELSLQ